MKYYLCLLVITMVVMATLIDDTEGWRRRASTPSPAAKVDKRMELMDTLEEVESALVETAKLTEELAARELEEIELEEDDVKK